MLTIRVPKTTEFWDERKEEFIEPEYASLVLEHSLLSISKWETKWCKPFLSEQRKTDEEIRDYIKCMTINPNVDPKIYDNLTKENEEEIVNYIESAMTATKFINNVNNKNSRETVTSELIYYWMIISGIPFECQKWPLKRLLTLIRICEIKNSPGKKMSVKEINEQNAALNAERGARLKSKG